MTGFFEKTAEVLRKNKYVLLVLLAGVVLLLLPTGSGKEERTESVAEESAGFSLKETEERLEAILGKIDGAGEVSVFLAVRSDAERVIASDRETGESMRDSGTSTEQEKNESTSTVILSSDGDDTVVTLKYIYPEFTGAVVVCEGADKSSVKLNITEAVKAATGLTAEKITVVKMSK